MISVGGRKVIWHEGNPMFLVQTHELIIQCYDIKY